MTRRGSAARATAGPPVWLTGPALAVLAGLLLCGGRARADELDRFLKRLQQTGQRTGTLSASWTQRKQLKLFRSAVTSKGTLHYQRPDRLRWEIFPPDASTLVVVGNRAELRMPGQRPRSIDLRRDRAMATLVEQLLVWLGARPADKLAQGYQVALDRPEGGYRLVLTPRDPSIRRRVEQIAVVFDRRLQLQRIRLKHPGGDSSRVTFDAVRRNRPLPKGIFD